MSESPKRRDLNFRSLDEVVADAAQLAGGQVETTGNYSFGQILEHLARTLDIVTGHSSGAPIPLPIRWAARLMRPLVLSRPMSPGFKLPSKAQSVFWPSGEVDPSAGLEHFLEAVERYKQTDPLPKHPLFGKLTREQSDLLQCRHCALHLSFVHPAAAE